MSGNSDRSQAVINCQACRRLRSYCLKVAKEKRKAFLDENYWGRPVPDFGDPAARLLIVGLAPAAHGANRTGRMFTGDRSGEWLYRALFKAGFANQPSFQTADDGLVLTDALITAVAHCAPPQNKPTPQEIKNCSLHLTRTFNEVPFKAVFALGAMAWRASLQELKRLNLVKGSAPFSHGAEVLLEGGRVLIGSYHPSQQNTFTGRLTEQMFDSVFSKARLHLSGLTRTK